ncbi:hypothetical protein [Sphingomonas sp.]|uniref:hypothetical protein n=1 Tax=Sphingomonas sp. TaxID=28214 RepID=UPI002C1460AF|nr:hypothetical protein [Sphingomonas sp.]HTG39797.1 hypothetical protein [Sphingomonas sp.]
MLKTESEYFRNREAQERAVAARCDDVTARRVHLELAKRYHALAIPAPRIA